MDKILKPKLLALDVDDPAATRKFQHWMVTCEKFMGTLKLPHNYEAKISGAFTKEDALEELKLDVLNNLVSSEIYADIRTCSRYSQAKGVLEGLFVKAPSEVYARHKLGTYKQPAEQSLEAYRRNLEQLSRDCNFLEVSAQRNREDAMLIAFLTGINDNSIRMRLLEEKKLTFEVAYDLALKLHEGHKEANNFYNGASSSSSNPSLNAMHDNARGTDLPETSAASYRQYHKVKPNREGGGRRNCKRCTYKRCRGDHTCKAGQARCYECGRQGHYAGAELCQKSSSKGSNGGGVSAAPWRRPKGPRTYRGNSAAMYG